MVADGGSAATPRRTTCPEQRWGPVHRGAAPASSWAPRRAPKVPKALRAPLGPHLAVGAGAEGAQDGAEGSVGHGQQRGARVHDGLAAQGAGDGFPVDGDAGEEGHEVSLPGAGQGATPPKTLAGGQGEPPSLGAVLGLPVHGDLPVGFGREGDPGDAPGGVEGVDGAEEDKAAALLIPARGEQSGGGPTPPPPLCWQCRRRGGALLPSSSAGADAGDGEPRPPGATGASRHRGMAPEPAPVGGKREKILGKGWAAPARAYLLR